MPDVTGIVFIDINGTTQESYDGATLNFGGAEATAQTGFRFFGHSEAVTPAEVGFTLAHKAGIDVPALQALRDATVRFRTDTGITYVIGQARVSTPPVLTGGGDGLAVVMQGAPAVAG